MWTAISHLSHFIACFKQKHSPYL